MFIILDVKKTKSTTVSRVKYTVWIMSKTIKQTKMKMFFNFFPKRRCWFSMTTVLSGFKIKTTFFGRSGTRGFSKRPFTFNGSFYHTMQILSVFFFFDWLWRPAFGNFGKLHAISLSTFFSRSLFQITSLVKIHYWKLTPS